ncbi:protein MICRORCHIDIA 7-like [Forsythia ovata]|uniref:Protein MICRORCHIDIA 7-like n=1 Tax=Forsythia ovata TaxID=205694 RepID=A0ABD1RJ32_9LAMI
MFELKFHDLLCYRNINNLGSLFSHNRQIIGYAPHRHLKNSVSPKKEAPALATGKSCSRSKPNERVSYNVTSVLQSTNNNNHGLPADATEKVGATQSEAQARNHSNTFSINGRPQVELVSNQITQIFECEVESMYNSAIHLSKQTKKFNNAITCYSFRINIKKLEKFDEERKFLVSSLAEERSRRDQEEVCLRKRIKDASETIEGLLHKIKMLDNRGVQLQN